MRSPLSSPLLRFGVLLLIFVMAVIPSESRAQDPVFTTLYRFAASYSPEGLALGYDGYFYGTTPVLGLDDFGSIFRLGGDGMYTVVHTFSGDDGESASIVIPGPDASLYGIARDRDLNYSGRIFKLARDGTLTTLIVFGSVQGRGKNENGATPNSLFQSSDGNLYGTTYFGGPKGQGTVFRLTTAGALTTLHAFSGDDDGSTPTNLIETRDGTFYGTTQGNMYETFGTVFSLKPTGEITTLHKFTGPDGKFPYARLVQGRDGSFYGAASAGGEFGYGTVFKVTPAGGFKLLHSFQPTDPSVADGANEGGSTPVAGLVQGLDGSFYGTTYSGGAYAEGTLYKITPSGVFATLHDFTAVDAGFSQRPLLKDAASNFYGATRGGLGRSGTLYRLTPTPFSPPVVTLSAPKPTVTAGSGDVGEFSLSIPKAQTDDVLVRYSVRGSAAGGKDYLALKGTALIKAGRTSKQIKVVPLGSSGGTPKRVVKLKLVSGFEYTIGTDEPVKVKILAGQ